ncbi:MAG: YhcN/YlaJ family sporulation lipoprotein [Clostridiales bacterium]|nr:YhcN/YlaJ family sporulation lipoprotein [Clostridiales bacterium]
MKKWILALLCMAAACLVMSGCAARNVGTSATTAPVATQIPMTAEPTMEATAAPTGTPETSAQPMETAGNMTPAEAGRMAERISEAVERISEIDDAEVVVSGTRVLVAVRFDEQYNAGLDDRMKQTIIETVKKTDESVTDVEITDDDTLYGQVKGLGEKLAKATGLDELADDFGDLWDRIVGRT